MKKIGIWALAVVLFLSLLTALSGYLLTPKEIPIIRPSHFESTQLLGYYCYRQLPEAMLQGHRVLLVSASASAKAQASAKTQNGQLDQLESQALQEIKQGILQVNPAVEFIDAAEKNTKLNALPTSYLTIYLTVQKDGWSRKLDAKKTWGSCARTGEKTIDIHYRLPQMN